MNFLFGSSAKEEKKVSLKPVNLLVIDGFSSVDWADYFKGITLKDGRPINVDVTAWDLISIAAYTHAREPLGLTLRPNPRDPNSKSRHFQADFLLIRNECRGINCDYRNVLYGFMYANIPSVNSLKSVYMFLERPVVHAELNILNKKLGDDIFPLIPQNYFASYRDLFYSLAFPAVAKVGHAHAGYGKMKIANHHDMEDFRSVLAVTSNYMTAEPYCEGEYDLRIQKIGTHYRVYKRQTVCGSWKTNMGSSHLEVGELTPQYKLWADEAAKFFGGLDICTVDAIHTIKGKEVILEVNGTSSGLAPEFEKEDNQHICDLVLERMNDTFCLEI